MNKSITSITTDTSTHNEDNSLHEILRFLRIVRFRKNIMAVALLVSVLLAGLYYATATRVYESKASLLVLQTGADRWSNNMSDSGATKDLMGTYRNILGSMVVLEEAVKHLSPEARSDFADSPPAKWASRLKGNLEVVEIRDTNVIGVKYRSKNPEATADVVNCVLSAYLEFMDNLHKGTARELLTVLTREKAALEEQLRSKESELLVTRSQAGDLVICDKKSGLNVVVKRVMRLNELLIAAHEKRLEAQSRAVTMQAVLENGENVQPCALAMLDTAAREVLLQQLKAASSDSSTIAHANRQLLENRAKLQAELRRYGPAHQKIRTIQEQINVAEAYLKDCSLAADSDLHKINNEKLVQLLKRISSQQLQQATDHESRIIASYEQEKQRAIDLDRNTAELEMLQLDVNRLRRFYDVVLDRIKNIDLSRESGMLRTRVLSRPNIPSGPVSPRLFLVAFCAVACGLFAGLGTVYIRDLLDDRFRSPEEMRMQLGVPVLATVRKMEVEAETGIEAVHVHAQSSSVESEAFRTMRTTITFCNQDMRRLVVSSSEPGDGKTTVASNLAVVYAQSDKRTLLIDADMRKPGMTTLLDMRGENGLSTCLSAEGPVVESVASCLKKSVTNNLDFIPSGHKPANAMELLASSRFAELLAWAEANYDQIIIDSPPSLVSDTAIIGQLVDGVVLVVQPSKSHRRSVIRAADHFSLLGVKLLGIVANHLVDKDKEEYGYGYGYGYGHAYGYGHNEDSCDENRQLIRPIRKKTKNVA